MEQINFNFLLLLLHLIKSFRLRPPATLSGSDHSVHLGKVSVELAG